MWCRSVGKELVRKLSDEEVELRNKLASMPEPKFSRKMALRVRKAYFDLEKGKTETLLELLKDENFKLTSAIRIALIDMLEKKSDFVFDVILRPGLKQRDNTKAYRRGKDRYELYIAHFIGKKIILEKTGYESALSAARAHFKIGRSKANDSWVNNKEVIKRVLNDELSLMVGPEWGDDF